MKLEIKKIKRSFCVVAGVSVLGKFRTEAAAKLALDKDAWFYSYWANSAGVKVENTPPKIVLI